MLTLLPHVETLYSPTKAEQVAAELQAGDEDGWTYAVVHDPKGTGYSYIAIYDDEGAFVAKY